MTVREEAGSSWRGRRAGLLLCIGGLLVLSGCGAERESWIRPGAGGTSAYRDLADCQRLATGPGPFHFQALNEDYTAARDRIRRETESCMLARGWRRAGAPRTDRLTA